ncbi:DUF4252 domain-containing protein [Lacinutrix salivirga]
MYAFIKKTGLLVVLFTLIVSCNTEPTLQTYFVENSENKNFITGDLPKSLLSIGEAQLTEEQQKAYEAIEGLNFLIYKKDKENSTQYDEEVNKMKGILKAKKFQELMDFSDAAGKFSVKYIGEDDNIDEFIVFGRNSELGFGVVRVLGDNMNPEQLMTLMDVMRKGDIDDSQLKGIMDFLK